MILIRACYGVCVNERSVTVRYQYIRIFSLCLFDKRFCLHYCVTRTEPFLLLKCGVFAERIKISRYLLLVSADYNCGIVNSGLLYSIKHPAEHRLKQHFCKNLRLVGFHSFAITCGKYYCVFFVIQSKSFLYRFLVIYRVA